MTEIPPRRGPTLPPAAGRYITALALVASAVVVGLVLQGRGAFAEAADLAVLLLATLGAVSVVFPLRVHHGGDVQGFNLTFAVLLTIALRIDDAVALVVALLMVAVGYAVTTRSLVKTVFNVSLVAVAGAVALAAAGLVLGGSFVGADLGWRTLLAVAVAAVVLGAVSGLFVSELIHRIGGGSRTELVREGLAPAAWTAVGDVLVTVLLTILADRSPWAVVLAVPMFAGLLLGYRGFLADRETARQSELLHDTSRQLLDGALDERAIDDAVERLRDLFGADRAALAVGDQPGPDWAQDVVAAVHRTGEPVLTATEVGTIAAPVRLDGRVMGVVVVGGRRGVEAWGGSDLDLLSTVAGEIAATLRTRRLLRQVEQERSRLASEKGKLTDVLTSASDGIVVLDAEGRLAACNPAMEALLGRSDTRLGRPWSEVLHLQDADGRSIATLDDAPLGAALSGRGRVERASAALRRPDGELRWLRCSAAPVVSDGTADGVVLVAVDVTRERELEQLRGDFIATVSHELRTPLTPLSGFLDVLRERGGSLGDDRRDMIVASMEKQVGRLSALIGDLLQVAEMERGMTRVEREVVSLDAALAEVVELETMASGERDRILVDVRSVEVVADSDAVRRILRALVSNGLKHTAGTVTVMVTRDRDEGVVRVRDEGPLIPESARETIFEPFRRLGDHLHRTQGPGLGLTVSRSLAEALGGSVEVAPAPTGVGNDFVVRLPAPPRAAASGGDRPTDDASEVAGPRG